MTSSIATILSRPQCDYIFLPVYFVFSPSSVADMLGVPYESLEDALLRSTQTINGKSDIQPQEMIIKPVNLPNWFSIQQAFHSRISLQWHDMSVKAHKITGNLAVCSTPQPDNKDTPEFHIAGPLWVGPGSAHKKPKLRKVLPCHDDVIKWKHFPRYRPFVRGIHRSPVNSPHKGQWRGALMFSLICARTNGWVNNGEAGDLRRHRAHCDVIAMSWGHHFAA